MNWKYILFSIIAGGVISLIITNSYDGQELQGSSTLSLEKIEALEKKAQNGDVQSQKLLNFLVAQLTVLAEQGQEKPQTFLGILYFNGSGVEQNDLEAFRWLSQAAEKGDPTAQFYTGRMYFEGRGIEQNYENAFQWFLKSAESGEPRSQNYLGLLYLNGWGVKKDEKNDTVH